MESAPHRPVETIPIQPHHSTLLALVWRLDEHLESADEVAAVARDLVASRRVILTGNFKGCRLD